MCSAKPAATPSPRLAASNQRELAARFDVSQPAVRKWLRDDRWPDGIPRKGPWTEDHIEQIRAWRAANLREDRTNETEADLRARLENEAIPPGRKAKIDLDLERAKKVRLERQILEGKYVLRSDVERGWALRVHQVRARFLGLPRTVAAGLVGLNAKKIERELTRRLEEICAFFAGEE